MSAAAAARVNGTRPGKPGKMNARRVQGFLAALNEQAQTTPHKLLPGTHKLRFSVRNLEEQCVSPPPCARCGLRLGLILRPAAARRGARAGTDAKLVPLSFSPAVPFPPARPSHPSKYFPDQPRKHENRFNRPIGEPSALSVLAFHNPEAAIEVQFRPKDVDPSPPAPDTPEPGTSLVSEPSDLYYTREFLDVWRRAPTDEPERVDITELEPAEILALVCEPVDGGAPAPPQLKPPTELAIPTIEGPALDTYIATQNKQRLQALRAAGKIAAAVERRARRKVVHGQETVARALARAKAAALAHDAPAEGLELFTFDDDPTGADAGAPAEGVAGSADDFEHSTAAWEAIEKQLQSRAVGADADAESKAPPS